ncbi:hypothetical protein BEP19_03820 [Ammoniphilus oxalaticus]|uniref:DUF1657 domain-containing protein n=1 Tax=Ammoniphilus oxalaticus TaxID=66863 RepID=A0A419SLX7_9BACL|nr:DUF1657 domain-containing protein [Ammoniphilus oxalaticus]RKD24974.1 hypothetical protein BEP19_03820 [Ammoniphilus oxalaticus]
MTVAAKLQQTIGALTGAQASVEMMALQSKDPVAKEKYLEAALELNRTLYSLNQRLADIEKEEPQYR